MRVVRVGSRVDFDRPPLSVPLQRKSRLLWPWRAGGAAEDRKGKDVLLGNLLVRRLSYTMKTLSDACRRYDQPGHKKCAGCVCECHDANPDCWLCNGTGSYPDDLPEFVVCRCVIKNRSRRT